MWRGRGFGQASRVSKRTWVRVGEDSRVAPCGTVNARGTWDHLWEKSISLCFSPCLRVSVVNQSPSPEFETHTYRTTLPPDALARRQSEGYPYAPTVGLAQLVRASDCGSEGRGFEPRISPLLSSRGDRARHRLLAPDR